MKRIDNSGPAPQVPYIQETFAVVIGQKLRQVPDLLAYGPATHAFYRRGTIWDLRIIDQMTREEVYAALEFTLAHDPYTTFLSEM